MRTCLAFVLDVDGTITDGSMHYTKDGKHAKVFGADDWCLLAALNHCIPVHFITGDTKGFAITQRRIEEECAYALDVVPTDGLMRWKAIKKLYPDNDIIFMGDGCKDWYPLNEAYYSITTSEALEHVKRYADFVTVNAGGKRAVAEACIHIFNRFGITLPYWMPSDQ